jgi:hypothetical protein
MIFIVFLSAFHALKIGFCHTEPSSLIMATYAAFKHVELYNVGSGKRRLVGKFCCNAVGASCGSLCIAVSEIFDFSPPWRIMWKAVVVGTSHSNRLNAGAGWLG